ncbi:S24 family peptidase [Gluconacetobacter azotocaptans]|uniref:S24 family peptidase n=2 Tax=Gluconacetobacter azotocaptans TaxID=142834 RepID=A0A7W4JUS3_9PROT|nr:S24 family peptidase [Gluconacetobacter azotocaptans]MBB2191298.1 S24 family peptidase [Gluconacetobacter azotocaptans]
MTALTAPRYALLKLITGAATTLKAESLALGRNHAYLQQYLHKGTPQKLPEDVRTALARRFGVSPDVFRDEHDPSHQPLEDAPPPPPPAPPAVPADGQFRIPEYNVAPQAGGGAIPTNIAVEDGPRPTDHWSLPRRFLGAFTENPESLVVLRVAGDSMEPDYQAGERVLVDTAHRTPSPPGVYVLWDGFGLVLKRLEIVYGSDDPVTVQIMSINPGYPTYVRTLDEVHINGRVVGKWVWK